MFLLKSVEVGLTEIHDRAKLNCKIVGHSLNINTLKIDDYLMSISLNVVNIAFVFWASFKRWAIRNRIRFILTRCSVLVPAISLVGSVGGTLTVVFWCLNDSETAAGGAATLCGGGCDDCGGGVAGTGGGVAGTGAAAVTGTDVTDSEAVGLSSTLGVLSSLGSFLVGAAPPSNNLLKHHTCEINYIKICIPVIVIVHKSWPALTVAPSSTSRFSMIPLTGEGTGTEVLNK